MKRFQTLRARFALWTAGLLLAILLFLGAFVYASLEYGLVRAVDNSLQVSSARILVEAKIHDDDLSMNLGSFIENIEDMDFPGELGIRVLDPSGKTAYAVGPYRNTPPFPMQSAQLASTGVFQSIRVSTSEEPIRVCSLPIVTEGTQVIGTLQLAQSLLPVQETLHQLLIILLLTGPLMLLIAALGGYWLAARALAPIDHMTQTARKISADDLSARLALPPTDDEVGRLAGTFNAMLARLDHAFRRERQFTADASHELRTPLTTMQTILSATLAQARTPGEYNQALVDLAGETNRMKLLVEELLFLARHDNAPTLVYESIDLSSLLCDVTESLQPLVRDKGLTLIATIPENVRLTGDSDQLIRLFINVLENAIKFTQQGQIDLVLERRADSRVQVTISDTGIGIAPEHFAHIFERFYRVDIARATQGTGLGLALALHIAQAHGGTITLTSEVGRGSQFIILLANAAQVG